MVLRRELWWHGYAGGIPTSWAYIMETVLTTVVAISQQCLHVFEDNFEWYIWFAFSYLEENQEALQISFS